jgi:zinc transport system substrate-binding protein
MRIALAAAATLALVAGCSPAARAPDGAIGVVAGFYPLQYVAEQVGGDRVRVANLVQPGAEPHDLELSPRQVATVADADLVVYLSGFQPQLDQAVQQEAKDTSLDVASVVPLRQAATVDDPAEPADPYEDEESDHDPHVWLDPVRLATITRAVAERLAALDPAGAAGYRQRAAGLAARLAELDREYAGGLAGCQRRQLVVSHAAFGYLADRYHLQQVAISGLSPEAEPTPQRLAEVAEQTRAQAGTTIFFETLVSPKVADAIAHEVGARTAVLDPIEGLPTDASGANYFSVMRANLAILRTALDCR